MRAFVDRVTDGVAVLLTDGGGRAYLPVASLPPGIQAGSLVEVTIAELPRGALAGSAEEIAAWIERLRAGDHHHG